MYMMSGKQKQIDLNGIGYLTCGGSSRHRGLLLPARHSETRLVSRESTCSSDQLIQPAPLL